MKRNLLSLCIVLAGLAMTSCLPAGSNSFAESSVVYVLEHNGVKYGQTLSGRVIVSDKIKDFPLRTFKLFNYNWNESYGYTAIGNTNAFNVMINGDVVDIAQTSLSLSPLTTEADPVVTFKNLRDPVYPSNLYYPFDDFWLFDYSTMLKKGQTPDVKFYLRKAQEGKPELVEIDIRIEKTGTPEASATEKELRTLVVLNMASLQSRFDGLGEKNKTLNVKFYYYLDGKTTISETPVYQWTKRATEN